MLTRATRLCSRGISSVALRYHNFGNFQNVLQEETVELPSLQPNEVLLKVLASPVNPSDFGTIQGTYGIVPKLPSVGGLEGVAQIQQVGSAVSGLQVGQRVIPATPGFGMWRTFAVCDADNLIPVSDKIPVEYSATLAVNPCTAFRLLHDFAKLQPGDWIIQSGASSLVGQSVVQLARHFGFKTINVLRADSEHVDPVTVHLESIGADITIDDHFLNSVKGRELAKELPPVKLALDCVGGPVATGLIRFLGEHGTLVNYGGSGRHGVTAPPSALIFRDVSLRGFWMTRWVATHSRQERVAMLKTIEELIENGKLELLLEEVDFSEWKQALQQVADRASPMKTVFVMN